ncbi:MAG: hypothetical protein HOH43_15190 [Candidatus Latescibacteria bacterium]|jgi:hypothetical protein|nr:hypothetical protein [Candidatus Latescibacterota bacterium]
MSAHVKPHNGTPTLFIDNKPTFAGLMWASAPEPDHYALAPIVRSYAESGIHLYTFDVGTQSTREWRGPGEGYEGDFDFSETEARFNQVLEVDPEARFHLRVHLDHRGTWWTDAYPDECELTSDGQRFFPSFASTIWREQAKDFLKEYIAHFASIGLTDRIISYQTGAGGTGEWVKGEASMASRCADYSPPMRRWFRQWLREHYNNDITAFRDAWNDTDVRFDDAAVPSQAEQLFSTERIFRDPGTEQPVIDYFRSLADLCADLLIDFHRTVKEATDNNALAGAFFGYIMELAWNASFFGVEQESEYGTTQRSGHLGLGRLLRSPYTDFIVSPFSYGFRGIGGHGCAMPPSEAMRVHGKLYMFEDDTRTYLNPPDAGFGRVTTLEDSITVLQRNFAEVLTRGQAIWWLGGSAGNPHIDANTEPAFGPLLTQFQKLGTFGLELDRSPASEIAVILDDESYFYQTVRNDLDLPLVFQQRLWGLPKLGAPADYYLLDDLIEGKMPPYKLYIFLNAFRLDRNRREMLARELRRDGRVAVWIYAPGYIEDEPGLEHMTDLTGFEFGRGDHPWGPLMHITDFTHPITAGLPQDLMWGTNSVLGPVFHLEDPAAEVLGQVVYSQGRCLPGLGVKTFEDWTSVYIAAPNIPAPVLRGLARFAGVHLYSDQGDVLYASTQLLSAHSVSGGLRTFVLPHQVEVVFDLYKEEVLGRDVNQFSVTLSPASTSLYYTGAANLLERL